VVLAGPALVVKKGQDYYWHILSFRPHNLNGSLSLFCW